MQKQNTEKRKIYSIQSCIEYTNLIEVETIILNGLYRFSILGINQKNSSDIKDRVYSALRSSKLLNLKSDNRKITVNLLPTEIDKKNNFYDLSIAISCLQETNQIDLKEDILAIGELSVLGNINTSNQILKCIHQSIENNIKTIICCEDDLLFIKEDNCLKIKSILKNNNIKFISGKNLTEITYNIKNNIHYVFTNENECVVKNTDIDINLKTKKEINDFIFKDKNIFKIILALCTKKNIFIENKKNSYIEKFIKNLTYYNNVLGFENILYLSNIIYKKDFEIIKLYTQPKYSYIDKQIKKDELIELLKESYFGFNIIESFISISDDIFHTLKQNHRSSILCFYNICPCGNNNVFFSKNSNFYEKCLCLQIHILRYKNKLKKQEQGFFDFYINNIQDKDVFNESEKYSYINQKIKDFKEKHHKSFGVENNPKSYKEIDNILKTYYLYIYDKKIIDQIKETTLNIIYFIKIFDKEKSTPIKDCVDLSVEFIKKDF